ncbi:helix-turn-helix domain-containing protein [Fibrella aquatilis]|uniref:AraC family transcriptional regulator n=1 Tax=Fibrella aquatilis TaxID=2817059 RepID=A0A939G936_9BACT|nr:helix-turn-helix domain-containing protein [Fibrella aquatilis]MBO0932595.1 AraC family transcriptional regulator [Fibrella aquatilis]
MNFYFSVYSTPLLIGFIQGLVYAMLLWVRGWREERLSDTLLGWMVLALCFSFLDYMLGFAGIEILWNELEFFPRSLDLLLPPLFYFYLRSQFDGSFRFYWRDLRHALPFLIDTLYHLIIFAAGPDFVSNWKANVHDAFGGDRVEYAIGAGQQLLYLYWSLQLYRDYRGWIKTQFSDTDTISFGWFRNFLIALTVTLLFAFVMDGLDLWLNLSFWQDWWDNLVYVVLVYYVSITGYAQIQPTRRLAFSANANITPRPPVQEPILTDTPAGVALPKLTATDIRSVDQGLGAELEAQKQELLTIMATEKPYLEPDLSLADLARRMQVHPVTLSQVINTGTGRNFNDFVNAYRVEEFKRQVRNPANAHLSFLGLALNCGFNSKATFNRAFRKFTGTSPGAFSGQTE